MISTFFNTVSGSWYNEYIYFRYRIHKMSFGKRLWVRLLFMPVSWTRKLIVLLQGGMEIPHVEMSITIPCVAHCRDCATLHPDSLDQVELEADFLKKDVNDFLVHVDRVHCLTLNGAEPLLHSELPSLLDYLLSQDKIDLLHLFTTGSVLPDAPLLERLRHAKILMTVSNYPPAEPPAQSRVVALLKENHVNYVVKNMWRNLGSYNSVADDGKRATNRRFARCVGKVHNLSNGEYHLCHRSAHGKPLDQFLPGLFETVSFRDRKNSVTFRKELKTLLRDGPLSACRKCKGIYRETFLTARPGTLRGIWYNEYVYFRYHIHKMPFWMRNLARLFFLPLALDGSIMCPGSKGLKSRTWKCPLPPAAISAVKTARI